MGGDGQVAHPALMPLGLAVMYRIRALGVFDEGGWLFVDRPGRRCEGRDQRPGVAPSWWTLMVTSSPGYDAFISYSHAHDGKLVAALHSGLERFAKRWYQLRALRIFYDSASLSAAPELWGAVETALR